jgi:hypothetical protein
MISGGGSIAGYHPFHSWDHAQGAIPLFALESRNLKMTKSLSNQLDEIDAAVSVLEDRRACIIHRMDSTIATPVRDGNLIQFPAGNWVTVRKSKPGSSAW